MSVEPQPTSVGLGINRRQLDLNRCQLDLNRRRLDLDQRQLDLDRRRLDLDWRRLDLDRRRLDLDRRRLDLDRRRLDLDRRRLESRPASVGPRPASVRLQPASAGPQPVPIQGGGHYVRCKFFFLGREPPALCRNSARLSALIWRGPVDQRRNRLQTPTPTRALNSIPPPSCPGRPRGRRGGGGTPVV